MNWFVIGYYGFGNVGDDTLLSQTITLISQADATAKIRYLSGPRPVHPQVTVEPVPRSLWPIYQAFLESDRVVFGGGTVFQDQTSRRSLWAYLALAWMAARQGKPLYLIGVGIGPLSMRGRHWVKNWLRPTQVLCRDWPSCVLFSQLGFSPKLGADLAFCEPDPSDLGPEESHLLLSVRPQNLSKINRAALKEFESIWQDKFTRIDCQPPFDGGVPLKDLSTPFSKGWDLMVGMRYHALVYAIKFGRPFIGLGCDPKVVALCAEVGMPRIDGQYDNPNLDRLLTRMVARIRSEYTSAQDRVKRAKNHIANRATRVSEVIR